MTIVSKDILNYHDLYRRSIDFRIYLPHHQKLSPKSCHCSRWVHIRTISHWRMVSNITIVTSHRFLTSITNSHPQYHTKKHSIKNKQSFTFINGTKTKSLENNWKLKAIKHTFTKIAYPPKIENGRGGINISPIWETFEGVIISNEKRIEHRKRQIEDIQAIKIDKGDEREDNRISIRSRIVEIR